MPQFDPSTFTPQLFWLVVCFGFLYWLMVNKLLPRIEEVLEDRQSFIDDNLAKAAEFKREAEIAVAAYEKALAESRAKAHDAMKTAAEAAAKLAEKRHHELADKLAQEIKAGEARIGAAKDKAKAEIRDVAGEVAKAAAAKLAGLKPTDAKISAAIDAATKEAR
jgi:F-type H+-transporting ATPase subunit b